MKSVGGGGGGNDDEVYQEQEEEQITSSVNILCQHLGKILTRKNNGNDKDCAMSETSF
jgi:hypothetical protein